MAGRSRHAKPKPTSQAAKAWSAIAAAATLAGVAAAFMFLQGSPASAGSSAQGRAAQLAAPRSAAGGLTLTDNVMKAAVHHAPAARAARSAAERASKAAQRRRAAARAARQRAQQAPAPAPSSAPPPSNSTPPPTTDAAHSALGICIRNAEEGGSYAWGPGNGGGAYQFVLGTWETYGGAASEYGVAGPAYQDRIFDNAIAAGGASNWTAYDGC